MAEAHEIDPVEEHAAVANAASLRARVAALEACLRDLLTALADPPWSATWRLGPARDAVLRARALLGEKP